MPNRSYNTIMQFFLLLIYLNYFFVFVFQCIEQSCRYHYEGFSWTRPEHFSQINFSSTLGNGFQSWDEIKQGIYYSDQFRFSIPFLESSANKIYIYKVNWQLCGFISSFHLKSKRISPYLQNSRDEGRCNFGQKGRNIGHNQRVH